MSRSPATRASLVPPDPFAGRSQAGPAKLMLLGLAITATAYLARGRIAPGPRSAEVATAVTPPARPAPAVASRVITAPATPVDAFGSIGGPGEPPETPSPLAEPSVLRLQSIMIGPRRAVCMINDKAYVVGDAIDGAVVRSITRTSVIVRRAGRDVTLALPAARP